VSETDRQKKKKREKRRRRRKKEERGGRLALSLEAINSPRAGTSLT
jgi:hypothetical protein